MKRKGPKNYLKKVRDQYEDYPYPPRDPVDESRRLMRTWLAELPQINHHLHKGRACYDGYRVLVAGAGTGDATIALAHQLADRGGQVVSLDISEASSAVAKERAQVRGLSNITFVHGSLLDLPDALPEELQAPFDYINCAGVLHHLADPAAGLAALKGMVKPDGGLGLMVYATYGRTGVYQMQELLRRMGSGDKNMEARISTAWSVMEHLPNSNWFKRGNNLFSDLEEYGDAGLYDLLLHPQDRSYTIPELYDWVEAAGLQVVNFAEPLTNLRLDPAQHLPEGRLLRRLQQLPDRERYAAQELYWGDIIKHNLFVSTRTDTVATVHDTALIPYLYDFSERDSHLILAERFREAAGKTVSFQKNEFSYKVPSGKYVHHLFKRMDGQTSLAQIIASVRAETGIGKVDDKTILEDAAPTFAALTQVDHLFLRHPDVTPFTDPLK